MFKNGLGGGLVRMSWRKDRLFWKRYKSRFCSTLIRSTGSGHTFPKFQVLVPPLPRPYSFYNWLAILQDTSYMSAL